jgi:HlyD family secretion protein
MEARVNVNENDIIRVHMSDTAIVDVDAYTYSERKFKGIVTNIANTANDKISADAVTEFEVRIKILNESYADMLDKLPPGTSPFRPGMTTNVDIVVDVKDNILMAPLSAVTTRAPKGEDQKEKTTKDKEEDKKGEKEQKKIQVVFINDNGIAKMQEVKTGISDFNNIEILEGLNEEDEIVTGPFVVVSKRLKDGDEIKKKDEKDEKAK